MTARATSSPPQWQALPEGTDPTAAGLRPGGGIYFGHSTKIQTYDFASNVLGTGQVARGHGRHRRAQLPRRQHCVRHDRDAEHGVGPDHGDVGLHHPPLRHLGIDLDREPLVEVPAREHRHAGGSVDDDGVIDARDLAIVSSGGVDTFYVSDGYDSRSSNDHPIYVYTLSSAPAPTAAFAAIPTTGRAPYTVQFTDQSTPASPALGAPTSWAWDFDGNGATDSTLQNPTHQLHGRRDLHREADGDERGRLHLRDPQHHGEGPRPRCRAATRSTASAASTRSAPARARCRSCPRAARTGTAGTSPAASRSRRTARTASCSTASAVSHPFRIGGGTKPGGGQRRAVLERLGHRTGDRPAAQRQRRLRPRRLRRRPPVRPREPPDAAGPDRPAVLGGSGHGPRHHASRRTARAATSSTAVACSTRFKLETSGTHAADRATAWPTSPSWPCRACPSCPTTPAASRSTAGVVSTASASASIAPPSGQATGYWPGWDIARDIANDARRLIADPSRFRRHDPGTLPGSCRVRAREPGPRRRVS